MKQHTNKLAREASRSANLLTTAQQHAEKLRDQQFRILAKASPRSTRLFGSVTEADVAEAIRKGLGIEVDKRKISLIDPIKVTGTVTLTAKLHTDVIVPFRVEVVTQEQLDARERERLAEQEKAARIAAKLAAEAAAKEAAEAAAVATAAAAAAAAVAAPQDTPSAGNGAAAYDRSVRSAIDEAPDAEA
jgi:ribosomal protein L9